MDNADKLAT